MVTVVYGTMSLLLALLSLGSLWRTFTAGRARKWSSAIATLLVALVCAGGSLQLYQGTQRNSAFSDGVPKIMPNCELLDCKTFS